MGSVLFYFGVIFFLHGSICCAFLPDLRKPTFIYQRIICSLISYFECAGACFGSGTIKPHCATIIIFSYLIT